MTTTPGSSSQSPTNGTGSTPKSLISQILRGESDQAGDYLAGAGGINLLKEAFGVQTHKQLMDQTAVHRERANRIGYLHAGYDVKEIGPDFNMDGSGDGDQEVDSSVRLSGDTTNVYNLAPGTWPPGMAPPQVPEQPVAKPPPEQAQPASPQQPAKENPWRQLLPWILVTALATGGATYIGMRDNTVVQTGGEDTIERTTIGISTGE